MTSETEKMTAGPTPSRPSRAKRRMTGDASVLYDAPGPRARARNRVYTALTVVAVLALAWFVYVRMDAAGQWNPELWQPFLTSQLWTTYILPGIWGTLKAAFLAAVLALVFGVVFGLGRLSDHAWIRIPSGAVVEFFRGIPLLIMIFFLLIAAVPLFGQPINALTAVVVGLMLYNGSVLAEIFRAGILAVPKGQSEAASSLGLRKTAVTRLILLPQAVKAMLPAIISQLVILLKDTALGYIVSYPDLLNYWGRMDAAYHNLIPAAIVITLIYIGMNMSLSRFATWLEQRNRRSIRSSARVISGPRETGVETPGH